jgi:nucleoside-diphosphate-sugar epimerase
VSDNTLARERMNWSPKVTLDDGLRRTIEFVRANLSLFRSDGYVR